jgi:DNA-binding SARP family transcriptional activator
MDMGQPRQRAVLAALAADTGRTVSAETMIDRVWGDTPPAGARRSLHAHITRIRRVLEQAGKVDAEPMPLVYRAGGYVLDGAPEHVDLYQIRRLLDRSRLPGRDPHERVEPLRQAVLLWRGEPLTGIAGTWAERMRQSCRQLRSDTTLAWAQAELAVGNPEAVISRLSDLAGDNPLSEPLTALLMRALCATGRPAEALAQYTTIRRRLADELGVDPSPELQILHERILRGGLDLPPATVEAAGTPESATPAELPIDAADSAERAGPPADPDPLPADRPATPGKPGHAAVPHRRPRPATIAAAAVMASVVAATVATISASGPGSPSLAARSGSKAQEPGAAATATMTATPTVNPNCIKDAPPPGTDLLDVPHRHPDDATSAKMNDWWPNDDHIEMGAYGLRNFKATLRAGRPNIWDLVIVRSCLPLLAGRQYRLALTAWANMPVTVRVRVQEPEGAVMSFSTDMRLGQQPRRLDVPFAAQASTRQGELMFQVGGVPTDYQIKVTGITLTS